MKSSRFQRRASEAVRINASLSTSAPLRRIKWVVYRMAPFAGSEQVLRYLSRYTHRVAISNRRLIAIEVPTATR